MSAVAAEVRSSGPVPSPVVTSRQQTLERLESEITELWGHISAASCRFLELVAEFDRLKGHEAHGLISCAQWLNWQCGIGDVAAREKVRVARALESLPKISEAFRRGRISYSKVRAITRVACPEDEHILLNTAIYGTAAHVERHVRKFRWCERRDEAQAAEARHRRRYLSCFHDEDGAVVIHAVLPPEIGALVQKAIEAAVEEVDEAPGPQRRLDGAESDDSAETSTGLADTGHPDVDGAASAVNLIETPSNVSAETSVAESSEATLMPPAGHAPFGTKRADALRLLAEAYLERRAEPRGSVADRFQVAVHIDQRLLARGACREPSAQTSVLDAAQDSAERAPPELGARAPTLETLDHDVLRHCELEGADRPLAIETARRLACDTTLVGIVEAGDGTPLDVGRRTRAIPPALQRALRVRDGGCRFPGCGRTRFTEGHHVVHWADGGETKLDNLVTLCRFHHRLIHEGGYGLHLQNDCAAHERFVFTRPDGTRIEPNGRWRLQTAHALRELNRERGLEIDASTSRCGWRGETMDYSMAIEAQQYCRENAGRRTTS